MTIVPGHQDSGIGRNTLELHFLPPPLYLLDTIVSPLSFRSLVGAEGPIQEPVNEVGISQSTSRIVCIVSKVPRLAIIRHRDPRDHGEVPSVEGYEIGAVLFGSSGDEGVRESGAMAPSVISPV